MTSELCQTCFKGAADPFRVWDGSKIVAGCVDDFHTGHLVTPSASASWHSHGKTIRARNKAAAQALDKDLRQLRKRAGEVHS